MRQTLQEDFEIRSDGKKVWVDHILMIGRFAHRTCEVLEEGGEPGVGPMTIKTNRDGLSAQDWQAWTRLLFERHNVIVDDEHRPAWLEEKEA